MSIGRHSPPTLDALMRGAVAAALLALAVVASACLGQSEFRCQTHAQCGAPESGAFCEVNGHCSAVDVTCQPSGRRYVHHAGSDADACVASSCPTNRVQTLVAGNTHACLLRADQTAACWGRNDDGQLGDGTRTPRARAVPVAGLDGVVALAAGDRHTCAVRAGGAVVCWGADDAGQLGDGGPAGGSGGARRLTPAPVAGVSDALAIAAGDDFSCALRSGGTIVCWGADDVGQLGDNGAAAATRLPSPVAGLTGVRAIAARGRHACAVGEANGAGWVACWGANDHGQLGNDTMTSSLVPVPVTSPVDAVAVAAGRAHTCVTTRGDGIHCWGDNTSGQVRPVGTAPTDPVPVIGAANAIAAGDAHTCAIARTGGSVFCFGNNDKGQLGVPGSTGFPARVVLPSTPIGVVRALAAGGAFSCALAADDAVFCWGDRRWGLLAMGGDVIRVTPARVPGIAAATAVSAGGGHTCVVAPEQGGSGTPGIWCWGANQAGQLGDGSMADRAAPLATTQQLSATGVAAGAEHSCASITANDGDLACWGRAGSGQLGLGPLPSSLQDKPYPSPVTLFSGGNPRVRVIAAGGAHTCVKAIASASIACFGANDHGQLGNGSTATSAVAVVAPLGPTAVMATSVSAGAAHTCALDQAGDVWCWGRGDEGQVGDGDGARVDRLSPVKLVLGPGITGTAVAAGGAHSCALGSNGSVSCWGRGDEGQVARPNGADAPAPIAVTGITGALAVVTGGAHSCALVADRTARCWGANEHGQLGSGTTDDSATPVEVRGLTDVQALSAGGAHTCALLGDKTVACWGDDSVGQLGDDIILTAATPELARIACP